ncbi:type VI secretion system-associated protein TagF [Polymorphobacter megasporae]|uniref:type VI secretion system-associated protein TagF n=1 Tax=Glacieibacterium megasporae TaxID=2835787 RepID=UPI001CAA576C|nr:type VI secretion system-associated protein TagF [Polymorphobacter megasporae]UAJ11322.1 type VI secretion system-associated protein TagF [Polymorphobacter megasporae]
MTATVGFFGKLPAHGDFIRRGLPTAATSLLDDWVQAGFGRADDPAAAIRGLPPVRFASSAVVDGALCLGTMIASNDSVGRDYVLVAVHLSPNVSGALPEPLPDAWDDWCARAEALLLAAQSVPLTADATQAALETAARATVMALGGAEPFAVPDDIEPATASWRPAVGSGERRVTRSDGLPRGDAFDRLIAPVGDGA